MDDRHLAKVPGKALATFQDGPFRAYSAATLFFMDPPDHRRLREAAAPLFSGRSLSSWSTGMLAAVAETLSSLDQQVEFDLLACFANRVSHRVTREIVGIPAEFEDRLVGWSRITSMALEPIATPEIRQAADQAVSEFQETCRELIHSQSHEISAETLLGRLLHQVQTGALTEEEAIANTLFIYSAGTETTPELIGQCVHLLLTHPEVFAQLQSCPDLLDNLIEETSRLQPPIHLVHRFVKESFEMDGTSLTQGQSVSLCIAAANRDPSHFSNPNDVDLNRPAKNNRHLSFGAGARYCIGGQLARLEGRAALRGLLDRFKSMRLLRPPEHRPGMIFRGLSDLWVAVGSRGDTTKRHTSQRLGSR